MLSENHKANYLNLLDILNQKSIKMFTVLELCEFLDISRKTLIDFRKGRIIKFELLSAYAALIGDEIMFTLRSELK